MSDPVDREIADHCRAFQALKGVGRQRGCDGCEAGDAPRGAMGPYVHIDPEDVRRSYLAHIPPLGI